MSIVKESRNWKFSFEASDFLILGCGILTTALTAILAYWLFFHDVILISRMIWVILPAGSLILGCGSVLGFFAAIRFSHRRMSLSAAILMLCILAPAYFLNYHIVYRNTNVQDQDGKVVAVSEVAGFWDYYKWDLTNRSYSSTLDSGDKEKDEGIPVGKWGYLFGFMEFAGFMAGGVILLESLSRKRYCEHCSRYFKDKNIVRTLDRPAIESMRELMDEGNEALIPAKVNEWPISQNIYSVYLVVSHCSMCKQNSVLLLKHLKQGSAEMLATMPLSETLANTLLLRSEKK